MWSIEVTSVRALGAPTALALALAVHASGCGGCPRARGTHALGSHPSATDVPTLEPVVVEALPGPPLPVEIDTPTVHAVVASQTADIRHCFEAARAEHPVLTGLIELDLTIAADGAVRGVALATNETGDGVLSACLVSLAERWHFPASPHGARVRVPFAVADPPPPPQITGLSGSDGERETSAAVAE